MSDPFDLVAHWYDRVLRAPDISPLVRRLRLRPGQRLLDLGGGTGRLSQSFAGVRVIVCDLSTGMVREAQRKGLPACQGRAESLPFDEATFDGVLVVDALHHFSDQRVGVQEIMRVLRPGGRLVLEEPDVRRPLVWAIILGEWLLGMGSRFFTPKALRALCEVSGGTAELVEKGTHFNVRLVVMRQ